MIMVLVQMLGVSQTKIIEHILCAISKLLTLVYTITEKIASNFSGPSGSLVIDIYSSM